MTREEICRIDAAAREALARHEPFTYNDVTIIRLRTPGYHKYRVTCEDRLIREGMELGTGISEFLMYAGRDDWPEGWPRWDEAKEKFEKLS